MPIIPLGIGSYRRSDGLVPEVILRNMYLEKDASGISPDNTLRIQRPGLTRIDSYSDVIRVLHYRTLNRTTNNPERLVVSADRLYSGQSFVGTVGGTGRVAAVSTPFATVFVTDIGAYIYAGGIAALPLPNDAQAGGVQDVDQLNGYAILLQPNGRFYWLVPGETAIAALNFATAESLPDKAVAVRRLGDEFWVFGEQNVEVWQPTGDQDAPFQRASGRNFERGCLYRDAVQRFDNTLVWVGDDYQVYRAASVPQVISDSGIAERIRKATNPCSAWTFGIDGHSFYVLSIPGQGRFAYDAATQAWSEFTWNVEQGYQVNGQTIAASSIDGKLYAVDANALTDDGVAFQRFVSATVPLLGKPPRNDSVSIGIGSSEDTTVLLRWKDGQEEFPNVYEEVNVAAPFDVGIVWRLGQPDQPYRTIEVGCIEPVRIRLSGMMANEAWR